MATVVVIDNHREEVMRLGNLLEKAFPEWRILPERKRREQEPFHDWQSVLEYLLAVDDQEVILCLDLSIMQPDWEDVRRGLRWVEEFRADRPTWTFVAYTKHSQYAGSTREFKVSFDGLLDKNELAKQRTFDAGVVFVRSAIESARRRRGAPGADLIPKDVQIVDSLGMRSFRAAFSDETLGDIIRDEASGWGLVRIESLTSGYSGAFTLALRGQTSGRSLIIKVAKTEDVIAHELNAQEHYLAELAPFGVRFAPISSEMRRLRDGTGVYYRQMPVDGHTVLEHCCEHSVKESLEVLERVTRMCVKVLMAVPVKDRRLESARKRFALTPVDVGRLETSARFISEVGAALSAAGLWSAELPDAASLTTEVRMLVQNWSSDDLTGVCLPEAVQHGDLNPGNVVIDEDGVPVLIDFQRLGPWPMGYDMARLAGLLRIRITGARDRSDWLPFQLSSWCAAAVLESRAETTDAPVCPEAAFCEAQFLQYSAGLDPEARSLVEYGYRLGSLWDLIKITSYTDISAFKRTWAMVLAWGYIQRLRRDRRLVSSNFAAV